MSFCVVFPLILLLDEDPVSKENLFGPFVIQFAKSYMTTNIFSSGPAPPKGLDTEATGRINSLCSPGPRLEAKSVGKLGGAGPDEKIFVVI
jgi:hypothetical protein